MNLIGILGIVSLGGAILTNSTQAFSLIGPYADWMTPDLGYHHPGDIGGPMGLNEEYRWNVPVVTYGFDRAFLDYFGSNGVAAVEQAIQILNDLPPASSIVLSNYPLNSERINFQAQSQGLSDLKSATLALLLEQMGLAQPTRNVFVMRQMYYTFLHAPYETNWFPWAVPTFILERNFDPETLQPSHYINETLYSGVVLGFGNDVVEFPVDPLASENHAVADRSLSPGAFYTGLTRDDVGGLRYMLSATNVNFEPMLPHGYANRDRRTRPARRRGVEKITFRGHQTNHAGKFKPMLLDMGKDLGANHTRLGWSEKRIVIQPDFLFSAADTGETDATLPLFLRTDTSRWIKEAAFNGDPDNAGPGIIRPPIKITFHKLGPIIETDDASVPMFISQGWASFDNSPLTPRIFPPQTVPPGLSVRLRAFDTTYSIGFGTNLTKVPILVTNELFQLNLPIGGLASLQTSTNQIDWESQTVVTNSGGIVEWHHSGHLVDWGNLVPVGQTGTWTNLVFFRVISSE
jgi:hypothetical protein